MKRCLIYLDHQALANSVDLLEVADQIYAGEPFEVSGVSVNESAELANGAFDRIIQVVHDQIKDYDPMEVSEVLVELQHLYNYDSILVPATPFGRMLAPRLAMRLDTGLVADVTAIRLDNNGLTVIRPAYSGRIMAGIQYTNCSPVMMSVRPGAFHYERLTDRQTFHETYRPVAIKDGNIRRLAVRQKQQAYDIRESDVLISGGGGMTGHFHQLEKLAQRLGGQVSASRKIVDQGLAPKSIQVGQSGKTVSPKLYIALGIYGAVQHVEGLKQVDYIIAVNTDRNAPICSLSDIVVEGDAVTFIEKLVDQLDQK